MSQWWVSRPGGDPVGPVSLETLILGVEQQKVPEDAYVCRVGEQQWHRIPQVEEIWDKLHPEQSSTNVVDQPWFGKPSDPAPRNLADADADADDATRVYDAQAMAGQIAQPVAAVAAVAAVATDSPASAPKKLDPKPAAQPQESPVDDPQKKPTVPRLGAVRAPAPTFRAPGLGNTAGAVKPATATPPSRAHAHAGPGATAHDGKAATHLGASARAIATSSAGVTKPAVGAKSDHHSPPPSSKQTGFQTMPVKASTVDKAHSPRVTPDKAALADIPKGTDLAAMLESKEEVSLSQTRPDRPVAKRAASTPPQSGPTSPAAPRIPRAAAAPSEPLAAPQSSRRIAPPAPSTSKATAPVPPKVTAVPSRKLPAAPVVAPAPVIPEPASADDEDATVIKPVVPMVFAEPEEATVVFQSDPEATASEDAETRPIRGTQPIPMPVRPMEASAPRGNNNDVRPLPAVQQPITVAHGYSVQHASTGTARIEAVPPPVTAPLGSSADPRDTPVTAILPSSPASAAAPLYDAAEDAPDHAPPAAKLQNQVISPRPAAGTPLPPTVIVSHPQAQVSLDALGHHALPTPNPNNTDATRPALRSLRPPGTIQISIGALIIGALALVVLVLLVVLLLR